MVTRSYQICNRCVMDTSDPYIRFDSEGICSHCTKALQRMKVQILPLPQRQAALAALAEKVKKNGRGKDYDCIIGVSGGVDSTTTAYHVKKLGLRPLAVHFDNGWDSELAVNNIKNTLEKLGIDLYTYVVDWEEFRELQLSFLKASVPNCEIPTDHGIVALLFKTAARERVRYILTGSNLATESIMPYAWTYFAQDRKHLQALHKRFGTRPLDTMPMISLVDYLRFVFGLGIRQIPFLNYIDYNKDEAKKLLAVELNWRDYGGKHYESVWTRFYQGYYLVRKHGYDKRRPHFSSMICSGLMTREQALQALEANVYPKDLLAEDMQFVIKKFGLTQQQFDGILNASPKKHTDYPSHDLLLHRMEWAKNIFRTIATSA